jgi:transposase
LNAEELKRAMAKVREQIEEYLRQCELCDEDGGDEATLKLQIERLREQQEQYEQRLSALEERRKTMFSGNRKRHRINLTDPDALKMKKVNGCRGTPGYNGQVSVDAESGLIVAAEAVSDANDIAQFSRQHAQAEETLGADKERTYVADSGYHSLAQLSYVQEKGVAAVIADPRPDRRSPAPGEPLAEGKPNRKQTQRGAFAYDAETDEYVCRRGMRLTYRKLWTNKAGRTFRVYARSCADCKHRAGCIGRTGKEKFKRVFRNVLEPLAEEMAARAASEAGRELLNLRMGTAEPVFGNLKENLGFRGVRLRGVGNVNGEFLLMCIGHNLNRLHRALGTGALAECRSAICAVLGLLAPFWRPCQHPAAHPRIATRSPGLLSKAAVA